MTDRISEGSGTLEGRILSPDYSLVPQDMRVSVTAAVEELLRHGDLKEKLTRLLTTHPDQKELDAQQLLDMKLSPEESIAAATILEVIIEKRWQDGNYLMHFDPSKLDIRAFDGLPVVDYEWMPTRVHPDAFLGGVGKLLVRFPAGSKEAETPHLHPGGRIILSTGRGRFNCKNLPGGSVHLDPGTVVLMPKRLTHNFSAYADQDWEPVSIHLPYAGIGEEAMQYEEESKE